MGIVEQEKKIDVTASSSSSNRLDKGAAKRFVNAALSQRPEAAEEAAGVTETSEGEGDSEVVKPSSNNSNSNSSGKKDKGRRPKRKQSN